MGNNIDALIAQVRRAFELFEPRKIDFGFLTLQTCLDEILGVHGDNDYTLPHIGKEQMLNTGILPARIVASERAMSVYRMIEYHPRLPHPQQLDGAAEEV